MNRRVLIAIALVLVCGLLVAVAVRAVSPFLTIDWHVIAGGGGSAESGGSSLVGTIGQAVTGLASAGGSELCSGFLCGASAPYPIFLPQVLKGG